MVWGDHAWWSIIYEYRDIRDCDLSEVDIDGRGVYDVYPRRAV